MDSRMKSYSLWFAAGAVLLFVVSAIWVPASRTQKRERVAVKKKGESRPDHPDDALRFRRLQLQDEKGVIPPDGLQKARQHVKQMRVARNGGTKPDSWEWLGPGNVGGRMRAIVIHPTNTNRMWVGSVGGGIWRTENGGDSWQPVNDFMANLAVSSMVINPKSPGMMYAGTGETFAGDGLQGAGVFNSTDGGMTWNQLPSTNPGSPAVCAPPTTPANCPWLFVNRLAISPDGNTILAATDNNIQRSNSAGANWTVGGGIVGRFFDIDFHPTDSLQAIAGGNGEAVRSTDGGETWMRSNFSPAISGRVEVAYAPSNPLTVYASVNQATGVPPNQSNGDVYRSTDGGVNYTRRNGTVLPPNATFTLLGGQGGYDNIIWVNPQDPNFIIVAGVLPFRSLDGGNNFDAIGDSSTNLPHADHHMIVAHPQFNNTTNRMVYFGNDGGIHRIADISIAAPVATGWVELNNNLGITQFYAAAGSNGGLIGGTQDNGNVRYTGTSESWVPIPGMGGDGGFCAADPTDPRFFYGEYIYLQISRSFDHGLSGGDIYSGISDAGDKTPNPQTANFIAPFMLDPNDANTMLAGGLSLWRSTNVKDATPTWAPIKQPVPQPPPPASPVDVRISAIVVSPITSNLIVVGHNNGDIFRTVNGASDSPAWAKIDPPAVDRMVTRLTIDSTRSTNWIYATFGGFRSDNVYRTTDNGTTWTDITGTGITGLPDVPVRSLIFHPSNPNLLYVGTEIGLFTSDDGGANWEVPQNGPANVSVDEVLWMGSDLIAVTHGRGLFRASAGVYVDCNYNGVQVGTFDQPFKTITGALGAAPFYRTIWLKPCTYFEPAIFNKHVEVRSLGGPATVRSP